MNYVEVHDAIIARSRVRKFTRKEVRERGLDFELHHIVPQSLGGTNAKDNLVWLTYREHFLVHWLLTKITTGKARRKMANAMVYMVGGNPARKTPRVVSGWQYALARKFAREASLGRPMSAEARRKIGDANRGYKMSPEHLAATRRTGSKQSAETRRKISKAGTGKKKPKQREYMLRYWAERRILGFRPMTSTERSKRSRAMKRGLACPM
jgi:hypothetical protein